MVIPDLVSTSCSPGRSSARQADPGVGRSRRLHITDARKLKLLEIENGRLKRMLADAMLDNTVRKDLLGKN